MLLTHHLRVFSRLPSKGYHYTFFSLDIYIKTEKTIKVAFARASKSLSLVVQACKPGLGGCAKPCQLMR